MVTRSHAILAVMEPAQSVTAARLRFRVWIAGQLAAEQWIDALTAEPDEITAMSERHAALAADADRDARPWLVEVYDPDKLAGQEYVRWGTDKAAMTDPAPVTPGELDAAVLGLFDSLAADDDGVTR